VSTTQSSMNRPKRSFAITDDVGAMAQDWRKTRRLRERVFPAGDPIVE
jgi:hypothetical protein